MATITSPQTVDLDCQCKTNVFFIQPLSKPIWIYGFELWGSSKRFNLNLSEWVWDRAERDSVCVRERVREIERGDLVCLQVRSTRVVLIPSKIALFSWWKLMLSLRTYRFESFAKFLKKMVLKADAIYIKLVFKYKVNLKVVFKEKLGYFCLISAIYG